MNARLLITDPQKVWGVPLESPLLVEESGSLILCTSDWAAGVEGNNLEAATVESLREPLQLQADEWPFLYLSPVRELPDNLTSPELLDAVRHWWKEEVMALLRSGQITHAPALTRRV